MTPKPYDATHGAPRFDVIVIGAGFGGLGAALKAAERGKRVLVLEAIHYPGGCAGRFTRFGVEWDAGATLFSGFAPGDLFASWNERFELGLEWELMDPVARVCSPGHNLVIPRDRSEFIRGLTKTPGAPVEAINAFFHEQERVAEPLWQLLKRPDLLPPLNSGALLQHLRRAPSYLPALRWFGRPLSSVLDHFGLSDYQPLRIWLDAACQVTVQASTTDADAIFSLGAIDYYFRGIAHIKGGGGAVAESLVRAIEQRGGVVHMKSPVSSLEQLSSGEWRVTTKSACFSAPLVIANLLPQNLSRLLHDDVLPKTAAAIQRGWGAVMLYQLVADEGQFPEGPAHYHVIGDPSAPFLEGNHGFMSISEATRSAKERHRTISISTHVRIDDRTDAKAYFDQVKLRLQERIDQVIPNTHVLRRMDATPRAFERFTGRHEGYVGGIPRRGGIDHYTRLFPRPVRPGLFLTGDSTLLGQSTLATAVSGQRTATYALR